MRRVTPSRVLSGGLIVVIVVLSAMITVRLMDRVRVLDRDIEPSVMRAGVMTVAESDLNNLLSPAIASGDEAAQEPADLPHPPAGERLLRQSERAMDRVIETSVWRVPGGTAEQLIAFYDRAARERGFEAERESESADAVVTMRYRRGGEDLLIRVRERAGGVRVVARFGYTKDETDTHPPATESDPS